MKGVNLFSDANISNIFSGGPLLPGHAVVLFVYLPIPLLFWNPFNIHKLNFCFNGSYVSWLILQILFYTIIKTKVEYYLDTFYDNKMQIGYTGWVIDNPLLTRFELEWKGQYKSQ